MPEKDLPSPVKAFLYRYIRSVEHLEILGLMSSDRQPEWTVQEIYNVILSTKESVTAWLNELIGSGLVSVLPSGEGARYQYTPPNDLRSVVSQTVEAYRQRPVRVIETIYRRDRDPAQGFADAFKFKNDD